MKGWNKMQDAYPGVLDEHEGHTPKICCPLRCTLLISRKLEKSLCLDHSLLCASFTTAVPSSAITRRCVLRSTLAKPWVPPVWPSLAMVNIDKIIKVTSASSYVLLLCGSNISDVTHRSRTNLSAPAEWHCLMNQCKTFILLRVDSDGRFQATKKWFFSSVLIPCKECILAYRAENGSSIS